MSSAAPDAATVDRAYVAARAKWIADWRVAAAIAAAGGTPYLYSHFTRWPSIPEYGHPDNLRALLP